MFRTAWAILTTAAMLVHALLGCCFHHGHACEAHDPSHSEHSSEVAAGCHAHAADHSHGCQTSSDSQHEEGQGQHDHHGPAPCHEGPCNFVPAAVVNVKVGGPAIIIETLPPAESPARLLLAQTRLRDGNSCGHRSALQMRTRTSVWLL